MSWIVDVAQGKAWSRGNRGIARRTQEEGVVTALVALWSRCLQAYCIGKASLSFYVSRSRVASAPVLQTWTVHDAAADSQAKLLRHSLHCKTTADGRSEGCRREAVR